ncbi:Auxin-responsive protein IAA8 [Striga hermonthica]|uniref:Auxin-responsive protein n=1 Tax=Striga hermonthica TaxID=68872 RepID=A0A9N7MWJ5_STRHE|nr:Auxin-responsive protein IAA8 [Striga hermonthica]
MTPPLSAIEGQSQFNATPPMMASSSSADCITQNTLAFKERNYLGLSDSSSVDSSTVFSEGKANLNFKATELRLGLPGSQSPERSLDFSPPSSVKNLDEKQLFPLAPSKTVIVTGNKRGFSDTENAMFSKPNWMFNADSGQPKTAARKEAAAEKEPQECKNKMNSCNTINAPAAKAQVVGWPPIRSFRKNTLATTSKNNEEVDGKGALFVKVSMDGAPYLRKVDLRSYATYQELSSALEKMFSCFTIGQCGPQGSPNKEMMSESKLRDLIHGSEYVLTYEDKDGDWMLVGDVPWEMFIASCKRLKIMKGSDAIGLG